MSTTTKRAPRNTSKAELRVRAEIESLLEVNGRSAAAHEWAPRVVMMAFERRCANDPANSELAECYSVAKDVAGTN